MLINKAVLDSDYSLTTKIGELNLLANDLPMGEVALNTSFGIYQIKRRSPKTPSRVTKKRDNTPLGTPQKRIAALGMLLTPPRTPKFEQTMVVYDMTQDDEEIVEIMYID
jgi:hypothetical protein